MKSLIVEIKGAGFFPYQFQEKNRAKRDKDKVNYYKLEPGKLAIPHVANLLRVLCGERPVPSLRKVDYVGDIYFEKLAEKCRCKIFTYCDESPKSKGAKEKHYYPKEVKTCQKATMNAWAKCQETFYLNGKNVKIKGLFNWNRMERHLGKELLKEMFKLLKDLKFKSNNNSCKEAIEFLNTKQLNPKVIKFCEKLVQNKKTSLRNVIINDISKTVPSYESISFHTNCKELNGLLVGREPEVFSKINAELIIPMDEELERRISNGTGFGTFMEGGFVKITGITEFSDLLLYDTNELSKKEDILVSY